MVRVTVVMLIKSVNEEDILDVTKDRLVLLEQVNYLLKLDNSVNSHYLSCRR